MAISRTLFPSTSRPDAPCVPTSRLRDDMLYYNKSKSAERPQELEDQIMRIVAMFALLALFPFASPAPASADPVKIVAAENFYGDVARQIGGADVAVTSILSNPDEDPHLFEASAATAKALADARIVIVNGADYDPWMEKLLAANKSPGRREPGSVMLSLDRCACGLAGNARVICVWHWKQAWLPTKCAPGISSGATTARFAVVEQEIRNSAAPAAMPAAIATANVCFDFTEFAVARRAGSSPRRP